MSKNQAILSQHSQNIELNDTTNYNQKTLQQNIDQGFQSMTDNNVKQESHLNEVKKSTKRKIDSGKQTLQHFSRQVLKKLLTTSSHQINRKVLSRTLKVCRRRIYDCLTISTSIGVFNQINQNEFEFDDLKSLFEIISLANSNKAENDYFLELNLTAIQRLTISIVVYLIKENRKVKIDELFQKMKPIFQSERTLIRRIYDILNVMSGFYLVQKSRDNVTTDYLWKGTQQLQEYCSMFKVINKSIIKNKFPLNQQYNPIKQQEIVKTQFSLFPSFEHYYPQNMFIDYSSLYQYPNMMINYLQYMQQLSNLRQ